MSIGSPTAYLLWAILSCIFLVFLILHLWCYDRFQCLKWGSGRQPGAFKRVMTYSYLATVPMLVVFSVVITTIKYKEGFLVLPNLVIPKPFSFWHLDNKRWVLPLYFVLSTAWSLELVTHLEELTFWLFLLHQGPKQRVWFHSYEFRIWYIGSMTAVLGMPLTTLVTRRNLETCQAWIFLVGSSASTATTICFLYVLFRFPGFIRYVKSEGAEPDVVVKLATFFQLNLIRVVFRFMFTIPLLVLAIDGVQGPHKIVLDPFWCDILLMLGGIGCFVSSAITLMIFFPRSITQESGYKVRIASPVTSKVPPSAPTSPLPDYHHHPNHQRPVSSVKSPASFVPSGQLPSPGTGIRLAAFRYPSGRSHRPTHERRPSSSAEADDEDTPEYESDVESEDLAPVPSPVSHALSDDTVWDRHDHPRRFSDYEPQKNLHLQSRRTSAPTTVRHSTTPTVVPGRPTQPSVPPNLHPYVVNFTSPIDLLDETDDDLPRAV